MERQGRKDHPFFRIPAFAGMTLCVNPVPHTQPRVENPGLFSFSKAAARPPQRA